MPVQPIPQLMILTSPLWKDYALLDSGRGEKLERFGSFTLIRPEAEAIWKRGLPEKEWKAADAVFLPTAEENGGHWQMMRELPDRWQMDYRGLKLWAMTSASRHVGVFPEQASGWDWMAEQIASANRPVRVLNLFGYTGLATLAAAKAGAQVTHIDASPKAVAWARQNQELSGLAEKPVRWIVDDALKFVEREARRRSFYDGIILDPPKFGRGPKGEVWEFYKLIAELLAGCRMVLTPTPRFILLTAYAVKASALTLHTAVSELSAGMGGTVEAGEIALQEQNGGRLLSTAIFARWRAS